MSGFDYSFRVGRNGQQGVARYWCIDNAGAGVCKAGERGKEIEKTMIDIPIFVFSFCQYKKLNTSSNLFFYITYSVILI